MELKSLNCNNCGAQLEVPDVAKFVTCSHCDSQLAVRHTESVWYTEKIERLAAVTNDVARQVARLAYINKLDRIDKEWEEEQTQYVSQGKEGERKSPRDRMKTAAMFAIGGVAMLIVGWSSDDSILNAFGLLLLFCGSYGVWAARVAQQNYEQAQQAYLRRRAKVRMEDFAPEPYRP